MMSFLARKIVGQLKGQFDFRTTVIQSQMTPCD